jgi:hypothetical protein
MTNRCAMTSDPLCRSCRASRLAPVIDLGAQPFAAFFPYDRQRPEADAEWPLRAAVCRVCWLVQLDPMEAPPEPADASTDGLADGSSTLREQRHRRIDDLVERVGMTTGTRVVEMASHGNYLTDHFKARDVDTLVIEPDAGRAARLRALGRPVEHSALSRESTARIVARQGRADLIVDDYLLSHHSDLDGAIAGLAGMLAPGGTIDLEFDHVLSIIEDLQFDAIRHGHYTYLSMLALRPALARHGLTIYDAFDVPVYGGSVRALIGHAGDRLPSRPDHVDAIVERERLAGLDGLRAYRRFAGRVATLQRDLRAFLVKARDNGELVVGYGAPSRAVTLLHACRITPDLLPFTVDRSTSKQGRRLPGTGIPIRSPVWIMEERPRYVLILTWNLVDEVMRQLREIRTWGGRFVVPIPTLQIIVPDHDR